VEESEWKIWINRIGLLAPDRFNLFDEIQIRHWPVIHTSWLPKQRCGSLL